MQQVSESTSPEASTPSRSAEARLRKAPDTDVAPRRTSGISYRSGHLESSRTAVLEDLGPVIVLPVPLFQTILLPASPEVRAEWPRKKADNIENDRWKLWPYDPRDQKEHEDLVFASLPKLFDSIVKSCEFKPTTKLINAPTKSPDSQRSSSSRPDGYLLRQPAIFALDKPRPPNSPPKDDWEDIAVPCEFKKDYDANSRNDNARKIIWSMHHIMRNDPCRRFTFGMTIENTEMRLWLCHRAGVVVTESFNFITDHDTFLEIITFLASASHTNLGWDPTLRRKPEGGNMVYVIDICTHDGKVETFVADKIISDFGAEAMQGRGTRVFRAKREDGSTVVVKDVWQDCDRTQEGDILEQIMKTMREAKENFTKEDEKLFLSVISHGVVNIDGKPDHTLDLIMRGISVPLGSGSFRVPLPGQPPHSTFREENVGNVPHMGIQGRTHMGDYRDKASVFHRIHYRIAFAELCQAVHEMHNLRNIFQALVDAAKALKFMFQQCNLLHRDISAGNIFYVDGHGVLADLEYAKNLSDDSGHDVRTGTIYFMAVEVCLRRYIFGEELPSFKQNPLHDLESLWWVAVWALFTHRMPDSTESTRINDQRKECLKLFPPHLESAMRMMIVSNATFKPSTEVLPVPFHAAAKFLHGAITKLSGRYRMAEHGSTIDFNAFDGIHDIFIEHLKDARNACPEGNMALLASPIPPGGLFASEGAETASGPPTKRRRVE